MTEPKFLDFVITVVNQRPFGYSAFYSAQPYNDDPRDDSPDSYKFTRNEPPDEGGSGTVFVEINGVAELKAVAGNSWNIHNAVVKFALQTIRKSPDQKNLEFGVGEYNRQRARDQIYGQELKREILQFIYWVNQKHPEKGIAWPILADNLDASKDDVNEMLRALTKAGLLERQPQFESFRIARGHESLEPYIINPQKETEIQKILRIYPVDIPFETAVYPTELGVANNGNMPANQSVPKCQFDAFICHASEDKAEVVDQIARGLRERGLHIWYDTFCIEVGDPIRATINEGLRNSRYGIVVLSPSFFAKKWPKEELAALHASESPEKTKILPVLHKIGVEGVKKYDPLLVDRHALKTADGLQHVIEKFAAKIGKRSDSS
ncbi:MAG: toll/interleukin-1 receptor domain-containing protein [candidate division Zixibacteria bacterium]|nr:toll/interleukin-1 receptor domain-containing protein [candidate division Zixibacteria bacterium]